MIIGENIAYIILTLLVNRSVPAKPDTHYTGTNGVSVYYDSSKMCIRDRPRG